MIRMEHRGHPADPLPLALPASVDLIAPRNPHAIVTGYDVEISNAIVEAFVDELEPVRPIEYDHQLEDLAVDERERREQ